MNTTAKPHAIHLHIDSVVLRGFGHLDVAALTAALHEALSRELRSTPALRDTAAPHVRAAVALPTHCDAAQLGGVLARTLAAIAGAEAEPRPTRKGVSHGERHG